MCAQTPAEIQQLVEQYFQALREDGLSSATVWEAGEKLTKAGPAVLPDFFAQLEKAEQIGNPTALLISGFGREAVPFIEKLKTTNPAVRYYVFEGFAKIANEEDTLFLINGLWDPVPSVQATCASILVSFEKISMREVALLLEELELQMEAQGENVPTHGVFRVHGNWVKKAAKEEHIPFLLAGLDHPLKTIAWHNALRLAKLGPRNLRDLSRYKDIIKRWEHEGRGQNRAEFYELLGQWKGAVNEAATGGAFIPKEDKKRMSPPNNVISFRKPPGKDPIKR